VGWAIIIGHPKRQFQTTNLLEVDSKSEFFENKHFTSCNVSTCPYPKVSKEEHISLIFSMSFGSLCPFKKKLKIFVSFQFHTYVYM
jgi:hypothetical protein